MYISDAADLRAYAVAPWAAITENMFSKPA